MMELLGNLIRNGNWTFYTQRSSHKTTIDEKSYVSKPDHNTFKEGEFLPFLQ